MKYFRELYYIQKFKNFKEKHFIKMKVYDYVKSPKLNEIFCELMIYRDLALIFCKLTKHLDLVLCHFYLQFYLDFQEKLREIIQFSLEDNSIVIIEKIYEDLPLEICNCFSKNDIEDLKKTSILLPNSKELDLLMNLCNSPYQTKFSLKNVKLNRKKKKKLSIFPQSCFEKNSIDLKISDTDIFNIDILKQTLKSQKNFDDLDENSVESISRIVKRRPIIALKFLNSEKIVLICKITSDSKKIVLKLEDKNKNCFLLDYLIENSQLIENYENECKNNYYSSERWWEKM